MILDDLEQRGLLHQVTDRDGLAKLLAAQVVPVYAGYDPTAASLHVGHLVPTILLKRFQLAGHKPIIVVGGATGMIGDPSGKSEERNLLDEATLATNVAGIRDQLARLLDFDDAKTGAVMTNNYDWTRGVGFLAFLRDIGKHLTLNYMLAKESVKSRIESEAGISYTEFSYMLLQAFDFVELHRLHACRLQVGGSDQYGNITAGVELGRRMGRDTLFGLTAPLLLDSAGQKMGKTATGEKIWLDATLTSPYQFYQYWFNRPDDEVPKLLRFFSLASVAEIDKVLALHDADRAKRTAQRELARAMTSWVHGSDVIQGIETASKLMFGTSMEGLTEADLRAASTTVPTIELPRADLALGLPVVDFLARTLDESKGAARRLISQGGAYVNGTAIKAVDHTVTLADLVTDSMLVLRSGKRNYHLVRVT